MSEERQIRPVPWDKAALGIDCFEIINPSPELLKKALLVAGHYTVKISPWASKQPLHDCGFYYCDTLIEPWCTVDRLNKFSHADVGLSTDVPVESIVEIGRGAFFYGRFHRDFNIDSGKADLRYENWLRELHRDGKVYGLLFKDDIAGFIAHSDNRLVLHAMSSGYRGKGLAKYFWSEVCKRLFEAGHSEIRSSISFVNMAVINLYAALGFRFRNPVDVYHRMTR
jgi:hypothetical protein